MNDHRLSGPPATEPINVTTGIGRIDRDLGEMADAVNRLTSIADRLHGAGGKPGDASKGPSPVPNGIVGNLHDRAEMLRGLRQRLFTEVDRIESAVG